MDDNKMEMMEMTETEEVETTDLTSPETDDNTDESGIGLGLVLAGFVCATTLGVIVYKKIKSKKELKSKEKRVKVDDEEETEDDSEEIIIDGECHEVDDKPEKK